MRNRNQAALLAAMLLGGVLSAQVRKGGDAPELVIDKAWNGGPQTFADLRGKVVILDFAQTW